VTTEDMTRVGTCWGILDLYTSMMTESSMTNVTSTVDRQPTKLSQESFLKLGMRIMGTMQSMLTATAKWKGLEPRISASRRTAQAPSRVFGESDNNDDTTEHKT